MRWWHYLTGWAGMELRGVEPDRLLSAMAARSIGFWDADRVDEFTLKFSIPAHEKEFVEQLAQSRGLECVTVEWRGLPRLWARLKRRKTLLICFGLGALLLGASRLFIWNVEVEACEGVTESRVRSALAECGVDVGAFAPGLSQDLVRNALLRRVPTLRWATVNVDGCCARVILRPKRERPELVDERKTADITASCAGSVIEVRALRGTALTQAGDAVLPGEVLISGVATGRFAAYGSVRAIGTVKALCRTELTAVMPQTVQVKESAGRTKSRWALVFGKRRINFYKGYSICPPGCAKICEEDETPPTGVRLPIRLIRETVTPVSLREQVAAEAEEELQRRLSAELERRLGTDGSVKSLRFSSGRTDGLVCVTAHAACEQSIGKTVPHAEQA